jgi:protein-disulfide isomerase
MKYRIYNKLNRDESLTIKNCFNWLALFLFLATIATVSFVFYIVVPALAQNNQNSNNKIISLADLIKEGSPHLGSLSAPVTIIDFSDFQCHLCARYVKTTEPKINETYIQTGKANLVFKHLPNRGTDSMGAAIAAQCANDQGMFWQFHNLLYKNQGPIDSGWVSKDNLKKFASHIQGLDIQKFNSCFDSQKYKSFVERDIALGASFGFHDTPNFIIVNSDGSNRETIMGAQPFSAFKALIDKKLNNSSNNSVGGTDIKH